MLVPARDAGRDRRRLQPERARELVKRACPLQDAVLDFLQVVVAPVVAQVLVVRGRPAERVQLAAVLVADQEARDARIVLGLRIEQVQRPVAGVWANVKRAM